MTPEHIDEWIRWSFAKTPAPVPGLAVRIRKAGDAMRAGFRAMGYEPAHTLSLIKSYDINVRLTPGEPKSRLDLDWRNVRKRKRISFLEVRFAQAPLVEALWFDYAWSDKQASEREADLNDSDMPKEDPRRRDLARCVRDAAAEFDLTILPRSMTLREVQASAGLPQYIEPHNVRLNTYRDYLFDPEGFYRSFDVYQNK